MFALYGRPSSFGGPAGKIIPVKVNIRNEKEDRIGPRTNCLSGRTSHGNAFSPFKCYHTQIILFIKSYNDKFKFSVEHFKLVKNS
jgi:hypothetical protein